MRKSVFCVLMMALLSVLPSEAKVRFGVKGGVDLTEMRFSKDAFNTSNRVGFFVGPTLKVTIPATGLGVDISGLYNQQESKVNDVLMEDGGTWNQTFKQRQFIVPLNVRYTIGLGELGNVFAFAGPQVGFLVGDDVDKLRDDIGEWRMKDSNFSVNVGGGITVSEHFQLTVNYNVGVGKTGEVKLKDATDAAIHGKTKSWQIGLTYFF